MDTAEPAGTTHGDPRVPGWLDLMVEVLTGQLRDTEEEEGVCTWSSFIFLCSPSTWETSGKTRSLKLLFADSPSGASFNHWPLFHFALVYSSYPLPPSLVPPPFLGALSTVLIPVSGPVVDILGGLLPPAVDPSVTSPSKCHLCRYNWTWNRITLGLDRCGIPQFYSWISTISNLAHPQEEVKRKRDKKGDNARIKRGKH